MSSEYNFSRAKLLTMVKMAANIHVLVVIAGFPLLQAYNSTDDRHNAYVQIFPRMGDLVDDPISVPESIPIGEWFVSFIFTDDDDVMIDFRASDCYSGNELFTVEDDIRHGQLIRVVVSGQLDYEKQTKQDVHIDCENQNGITGDFEFELYIEDVNDNAPAIAIFRDQGVWEDEDLTVYENTPVGTPVAYVGVLDEDAGANGQVQCSLDTTKFHLQATRDSEFEIRTVEVFDYERRLESITVTLSCEDESHEERLGSSVTFRVKIADRNDNHPRLMVTSLGPNNTLTVLSDLAPGSIVARVAVFDADMDGQQPIYCRVYTDQFSLRNIHHGQYLLETVCEVSDITDTVFAVECNEDYFHSYIREILHVNVVWIHKRAKTSVIIMCGILQQQIADV